MPSRLSVVMVQTMPPSTAASQLAEAVVGELIGMPEIDLTLVESLATIAAGSTDLLTLESLSGDLALLAWDDPAASVDTLKALGVDGHRSPHQHDPEAPSGARPVRRIYAFDLSTFTSAREVCSALAELKSKRQVRTFSLSIAGTTTTTEDGPRIEDGPESGHLASAASPPHPSVTGNPTKPDAKGSPAAMDLDDLLDQLDELDP